MITAFEDGKVARESECRNVQGAIELEMRLISDPPFAAWWAHNSADRPLTRGRPNLYERASLKRELP